MYKYLNLLYIWVICYETNITYLRIDAQNHGMQKFWLLLCIHGQFIAKNFFILNKCAISCKSCCVLIQKLCEILCKKSHFLQKRKMYGSPWTWQHKLGKRLRFIIFMFIGIEFAISTARPHLFRWPFSCNIYIIQYFIFKKYKL